jgi:hypothetical protein
MLKKTTPTVAMKEDAGISTMLAFFFPSPSPYINTTSTNDAPMHTIRQYQASGRQKQHLTTPSEPKTKQQT